MNMTTTTTARAFIAKPWQARALHEGKATLILAPVEPQPIEHAPNLWRWPTGGEDWRISWRGDDPVLLAERCPVGVPSARLFVQEAWGTSIGINLPVEHIGHQCWPVWYAIDDSVRYTGARTGGPAFMTRGPWRAAATMPRWAARTVLEVVDVRVFRFSKITRADMDAYGTGPLLDALGEPVEQPVDDPWLWALTVRRVKVL